MYMDGWPGRHSAMQRHLPPPLLRLMPLGGSITYGLGSSHGNGYRQALRDLLVADGHPVQMVGSRRAGTMSDNANEGWRGFTITQIEAKARRYCIPPLLPNLVTLNAGSNDCIQDLDLRSASGRMADLLAFLWAASPGCTILLSTLLVSCDEATQERVVRFNDALRELARRDALRDKRLVLVDMQGPDGPRRDQLVDGTHPNDDGYVRMARIWHRGVGVAMAKGFLQPPTEDAPL
ncbi:hypothetical protein JDV02_004749 [Purpureocillium takamizusanense]|uniref:SGNH hydrolase-type esterase domain-containing protein n=1 Tax=Purpureocillium takamizusanense TaxID=2060973 RepID=A0A9Q8VAA6_9HYPO|nr:uncharacterized protein JDV02_004749 [Purpureocillium takamizusanense]UNI18483.1 hypothetical protein JDV02_004749 [Purpureocillium takamizusanense]